MKQVSSEFREDYVHNRSVIIAPGRAKRHTVATIKETHSNESPRKSPFVPENIDGVKAILTLGRGKHWRIKVIKNIFPILSLDNDKAYGTQEVVIETPQDNIELADLPEEHIAEILSVYGARVRELSKNKRFQYILVFKNNGGTAGATINHAHSQIFASDRMPAHVWQKLARAQEYRVSYGRSYYLDLIKKERRGPRFISENDHFISLTPYASIYNYEAWVLAKREIDNVSLFDRTQLRALAQQLKLILTKLNQLGLSYNFYMHQVPYYSQEHFYLRIAPRRDVWAGIELGSRLYVNTVPPEEAAAFYREKSKNNRTRQRARRRH